MKYLLSLFVLFAFLSCNSKKEMPQNNFEHTYAKMLERLHTSSTAVWQYKGEIVMEKEGDFCIFHYEYGGIDSSIKISEKHFSDFLPLFADGRLHPHLVEGLNFSSKTMTYISVFEEKNRLSGGKKRTYKIWSWGKNMANPCEYIVEMENIAAVEVTSTKEFVERAIVVSVSPCSVII